MRRSMRKHAAIALAILLAAAGASAQITAAEKLEVDKLFGTWNKNDSPGAAVGVVRDGRLIFSKGYGMADLEHDVPLTPKSVFYAASVSKQFVTMAILLLEEQGKLGLDDEIQKYLPDFPRYEGPLTIRNFIHHTSGVRDSLTLWELSGRDIYDHVDKDAMYDLLKRQKELNFKPGEQYLYSNACYFVLALIVEKVSGQPIKEFAEEHMFKPLGMKSTHFHDDQYHIVKDRVFSYSPSPNGFRNLIMRFDLVGSGGLYTNVDDLFLWDQNFYHNKLGKGRQDLIRKMETDGVLNSGESAGYAFGLQNGEHRGLKTIGHGGALAGYRTFHIRYPDQNFSVIVLANISSFDSGGKAREVAEIFLKDEFKDQSGAGDEADRKDATEASLTESQLKRFTGHYFSPESGILVQVTVEAGKLQFHREGSTKTTMLPLSKDSFRVLDGSLRLLIIFAEKDESGPVMRAEIDGGPVFEFEPYKPASYTAEELSALTGRYFSQEVNAYYELKKERDGLRLYIADQNIGSLRPVRKSLFINDKIGLFEFKVARSGKPSGFILNAGRVRNLKFVRQ